MAINHYFEVFSNDGSTTLFTSANTVNGSTIITVTETGLTIGTETYTYSGTKKFVGVSFSENSTSPDLAIGESFDGNTAYAYIVEAEATTSGVTISYNGEVVATIPSGNKATLPIKDLKMKTDIVITVPSSSGGGGTAKDSAIPIEVATEAEMTTLLESGEVGGVYKYTGTTGTYENGALYVLENAIGTFTHQYTGDFTASSTFEFEVGMTWREWVDSAYNTTSSGSSIYITNGLACREGGTGVYALHLNGVGVYADDLIVADATYTSAYATGGGGSN